MLKLSIITINFNNKPGLEKTIKSVLEQTFIDFEYIVIDGGSTDGSVDIINDFQSKIKYWVSEKDSGIYNAMNKGIEKAKGEYCFFLNSGDVFLDNKVVQDVFFIANHSDIIYGNLLFTYVSGAKRKGVMPKTLTFKHMIQDTLWHPVSFIKTTLFDIIGKFDEKHPIVADYDFFLKAILIHKVTTQKINRTIAIFRQDGISASPNNKTKILEERNKVQMKYFTKDKIDSALKTTFKKFCFPVS